MQRGLRSCVAIVALLGLALSWTTPFEPLQALADVAVHLVPTDWAAVLVADRLTDRPARQSATTDTELLGTVADIAGGVASLCRDDAAFVTGHILYVDGGITSVL